MTGMDRNDVISTYQPLLYSIALKMTGVAQDAEDLVNDTFLNWLRIDTGKVRNTKAYLIRSVTNACHNHLSGLKRKKEEFLDHLKHDIAEKIDIDFAEIDLRNEIHTAVNAVMKKLEPVERAVFMLREVFNFDYNVLSDIFNKKDDNCRRIMSRAREKLRNETDGKLSDVYVLPAFLNTFKNACDLGELYDFIEILKKDIAESVKKSGS